MILSCNLYSLGLGCPKSFEYLLGIWGISHTVSPILLKSIPELIVPAFPTARASGTLESADQTYLGEATRRNKKNLYKKNKE